LTEMQIAVRSVLAAQLRLREINPLDYCYYSLQVQLRALERSGEEFKLLSHYAYRSMQPGLRIYNIFAMKRKGEDERFASYASFPNRVLLWHGSGLVNWSGILSQGLRIAPPEADATGYMFGKGVYFADMLSKSFGYCQVNYTIDPNAGGGGGDDFGGRGRGHRSYNHYHRHAYRHHQHHAYASASAAVSNQRKNKFSLLALCEVALGTMKGYTTGLSMSKPDVGYHSTKGLGQRGPDMASCLTTHDGVIIPSGPIVDNKPMNPREPLQLGSNEYIVYDEAQVRMRYLVQVGPR